MCERWDGRSIPTVVTPKLRSINSVTGRLRLNKGRGGIISFPLLIARASASVCVAVASLTRPNACYFAFGRSNVTRICWLPGVEENSVGRSFSGGAKHNLRVFSPSS
jgi:hypothetical protein